jgi:hypothetical protein
VIPVGFNHKYILVFTLLIAGWGALSSCSERKYQIDLPTLLDEMVSEEAATLYPVIPYRTFSLSGRAGEVLFDQPGPGVITRIRLMSEDKRGTLRFYFDGSASPDITLNGYDLSLLNIPETEGGLLAADGSVLYLPVPYNESCRITFEDPPGGGEAPAPKDYQINYRQYSGDVSVETFSSQKLARMKRRLAEVNQWLMNPDSVLAGKQIIQGEAWVEGGDPLVVNLPRGENAVYRLQVKITMPSPDREGYYAQEMRDIILQGIFDGKMTVRAPISDLSGGGTGAPYVKSRYLDADGKGQLLSRWLMPYREKASLAFINEGKTRLHISYTVYVSPLPWDENRSLYFHASWKEEMGLGISPSEGSDWNFASIAGGRGVYKGDAITVYNHTTGWYGNGGVEMSLDDEDSPSYAESSAAGYYNVPRLPLTSFNTPFGGAPRADLKSSHGYSSMFRTRILDDIPFTSRLRFDMQLLGEKAGTVDYAVTLFWYGDRKVRPDKAFLPETWGRTLLPAPADD